MFDLPMHRMICNIIQGTYKQQVGQEVLVKPSIWKQKHMAVLAQTRRALALITVSAVEQAAPITIQGFCHVTGWPPISLKCSHEFVPLLPLSRRRSVLDIMSDICTTSLVGAFSERPCASNGVGSNE